ncbi:hypothetical protein DFJ58DRAFT_764898 [Suillus subalutaceus]|uniref:uncharacterized protein n=1 Tax=Suillus subalutaceus TaxID=48586 RepID=UPI001B85D688|nr:uncharacterized protein DFJ58DRAFT_764898 [Suillus subalutaceus]KAG1870151.1 hypothetical protein DFJ58DRAFT_764898 [Suillus subalutaceus]
MSWSPSTPSSLLPDASDSQLLSGSLPLLPESFDSPHTGPGGADLSLSELSLEDKDTENFRFHDKPRFSLLAPTATTSQTFWPDQSRISEDDEYEEGNEGSENDVDITMIGRVAAAKAREDKLQSDLYVLKKLNASFALFNDALRSTQTATEQVATQLAQTDALLDKYVNMLGKSEAVAKLIFDEQWEGAEADEELLQQERQEALEQARLEKERLEREEAERREAEERARAAAEEAARHEAERAQREVAATKAPRGRGTGVSSGVRGVRGTRATATSAAARGTKGIPRAASTNAASAIPRSRSTSATGNVGSLGGGTRPGSSAGRGTGLPRGVPRRG